MIIIFSRCDTSVDLSEPKSISLYQFNFIVLIYFVGIKEYYVQGWLTRRLDYKVLHGNMHMAKCIGLKVLHLFFLNQNKYTIGDRCVQILRSRT